MVAIGRRGIGIGNKQWVSKSSLGNNLEANRALDGITRDKRFNKRAAG